MMEQVVIREVLQVLELPESTFDLYKAKSIEEAMDKLKKFKGKLYNQRKVLAKKYHPDFNNGSDDKMKEINNAIDSIKHLRLIPVQRPATPTIVVHYQYGEGFNDSTTTGVSC